MKRLHIVGCPRSGTTLMMELMRTCFNNNGCCEHEESLFHEPPGHPELYFSKQPTDIRYLHRVFLRDPNLFVLNMLRDPRDVVSSRHQSKPGLYFCNLRVWLDCYRNAKRLEGHARFWTVRYESLTTNPDAVQQDIVRRFPFLAQTNRFSEYHRHAQPSSDSQNAMSGLRPINANRQRNWENHLPRIKAQLQRYPELPDLLMESGYEQDRAWTQLLSNVLPQEFPCRYPESQFFLKTLETRFRKYLQSSAYLARHHVSC